MKIPTAIAAAAMAAWAVSAAADSTAARCDIYPVGSDHTDKMIACTFAQRQGYITISRDDGVTHDLAPTGDTSGAFEDQNGRPVYRQSGLGDQGLIFRFPDESVFVYWNTAALDPPATDNPTAPFSTRDYDATTLLRCKAPGAVEFGSCPHTSNGEQTGFDCGAEPFGRAIHDQYHGGLRKRDQPGSRSTPGRRYLDPGV